MISIDEAWNIINSINDEAHGYAYAAWLEADEEDDEDLREEASNEQREHFQDLFEQLRVEVQEDIMHYAKSDHDFREQFECFYGDIE